MCVFGTNACFRWDFCLLYFPLRVCARVSHGVFVFGCACVSRFVLFCFAFVKVGLTRDDVFFSRICFRMGDFFLFLLQSKSQGEHQWIEQIWNSLTFTCSSITSC